MLRAISGFYGHQLSAVDGNIGHVKDFYFDDQRWGIRFLVADTGSWLSGQQVLITPHAFKHLDHVRKLMPVSLTKEQIEECPSIETHKPVSRQFEINYYRFYGLPFYWVGDGMWGISSLPISTLPLGHPTEIRMSSTNHSSEANDPHLRSTRSVHGYSLKASDGEIGHISDFLLDETSWVIRQLVVKTGGWFSGNKVVIPTSDVEQISYEESAVTVRMTRDSVKNSPAYYESAEVSV